MRALGLALTVAMLLPLLPAAAVFAGTDDPGPITSAVLAEGEPEPSADPTPPPPDPTPTADPTATPDPTSAPDATPSPDPTATSDPTTAPDPTATPAPDQTPADPAPAAEPTPSPDPATLSDLAAEDPPPLSPPPADAQAPTLVITRPASGTTIWVRANDAATVEWALAQDADPVATKVTEEAGQIDQDGICATAEVVPTWTRDDPGSPLTVTDLAVDSCYRYAVELKLKGGEMVVERSGWFRVLKAWTGSINLYRSGVFSTQRKSSWCVGAAIQMMKNIVRGQSDRSYANQETYQRSARSLDLYIAGDGAKGSDPEGWAAALRVHGAGDTYHVVEKRNFRRAVRAAVRALRKTGKPVGLLVGHGSHAWVLTGFSATADPGVTDSFEVTAVYAMGPLYPRPKHYGFDPPPNKRVTIDRLRSRFLTRYHDRLGPSRWDGSYVIIVP
jgi:hypothetical protein